MVIGTFLLPDSRHLIGSTRFNSFVVDQAQWAFEAVLDCGVVEVASGTRLALLRLSHKVHLVHTSHTSLARTAVMRVRRTSYTFASISGKVVTIGADLALKGCQI